MADVDWDTGLPLGVLSLVADLGGAGMSAMRGVSKSWTKSFDDRVTKIRISSSGPPPSADFAARFSSLEMLDLGSCPMPEAGLACLSGLQHLSTLTLGNLPTMEGFSIGGVLADVLSNAGLQFLKGLPITSLDLTFCFNVTKTGLAHLQGLPLARLELMGTNVETLEPLRGLPLTHIGLSQCNLTDAGLAAVQDMPLLASLDLLQCRGLSDAGLAHLRAAPMTALELSGCGQLSGEGLAQLRKLPLTSLGVAGWWRLTDDCLASLKGMPLSDLNLCNCKQLTEGGLEHLRGLPLASLILQCYPVTGRGLQVLRGMPLTSLSLAFCPRLRDADMAQLRGLPLTSLSLAGCQQLTPAALKPLRGMGIKKLECPWVRGG